MTPQTGGKTAFVFAGGGSFGAIQVGMLDALLTYGVQPDLVVGASVGALNGAYFAGNPTLQGVRQLEQLWCDMKRSTLFPMSLRRVAGIFSRSSSLADASGLRALIEQNSGPAVDAILASCAIPAIFPAVLLGKDYLIDGAIAGNTPVSTAAELGASRLIVLPTGYACALSAPPSSAIASALHALNMLISHQLVQDLELLANRTDIEVLTVPPLCPLSASPYDFSRAPELIERARQATSHWLAQGGLQRHGIPGALRPHTD